MSIKDFMADRKEQSSIKEFMQASGKGFDTVQERPKSRLSELMDSDQSASIGIGESGEAQGFSESQMERNAAAASIELESKGIPQKSIEGIGSGIAMGHDVLFGGAKKIGEGIATGLVETGVYIPGTDIGFGGQRQRAEEQGVEIDRSGDPTGLEVIGGAGEVGLDVVTGGIGGKLITQAGKAVSKAAGEKVGQEFTKQLGRRLSTMPQLAQNVSLGAGYGVAGSLQTGDEQLDEVILDAAIGAGLGGSLSAIGKFAGKTAEKADAIGSANKTVFKAIKPRLTKKRNLNKVEGEYALANKTLVDMGIVPTDVKSYRDGIAKAKDDIWSEISQKVEEGQGVVDFGKIADEVRSMANETALKRVDPNASNKLNSIADGLVAEGANVSPAEAERVKQYLNAELSGAFGEFNLSKAEQNAKKRITASIGKQLDDILSVDRPGEFQELKNKYGALAAITDDVEKRFIVFERSNPAGLVESFGAVEGGSNILKGIMTASPSDIIKGAAQFGLGRMQKKANDANELIKKSFKKLNQSYPSQSGKLSTPEATPQKAQSSQEIIPEASTKTSKSGKIGEMGSKKKYNVTVNLNDPDDIEYLKRFFSDDTVEEIVAGKTENWRGQNYEDIAKINIVRDKVKTVAEQLDGKMSEFKPSSRVFYHGTSGGAAESIMRDGFLRGSDLPEDAIRGGGYGNIQNSISFAETPKEASIFSSLRPGGRIIESELNRDAKVVSIEGIEDAMDLEPYIDYLKTKKIDAVYIGGGEKELVVLEPKSIKPVKSIVDETLKK